MNGINQLIKFADRTTPNSQLPTNIILLDDAYQHRRVKPGLSVLLTEYDNLFYNDHVLPSGRLREFRAGYKRADIIIVTKAPEVLQENIRREIIEKINPQSHQKVYFSFIKYGSLIALFKDGSNKQNINFSILNSQFSICNC